VAEIQIIGRSPDRRSNRSIGVRHFASPEDEALGTSEVTKSREAIRTVHLEGTRGSDRGLQGKVPIGEPHREIAESGYRESRGQSVYAFRHCDVRNPDKESMTAVI
jgi:hypothetical protein